jgi:hypothetical protein
MPTRTWDCLNRNCRRRFVTDIEYPECPRCQSVKLKWVPQAFAIAAKSPQVDRDVRDLADRFGMTDIASPVRGEPAKKPLPAGVTTRDMPLAQGWNAKVPVDQNGNVITSCVPTGMTSKVQMPMRSGGSSRFEGTQLGGRPVPIVEAAHRPRSA